MMIMEECGFCDENGGMCLLCRERGAMCLCHVKMNGVCPVMKKEQCGPCCTKAGVQPPVCAHVCALPLRKNKESAPSVHLGKHVCVSVCVRVCVCACRFQQEGGLHTTEHISAHVCERMHVYVCVPMWEKEERSVCEHVAQQGGAYGM